MADIYFPEDLKAYVYKWAEKEVSDTVVNGSRSVFSFDNTILNILKIGTTPVPDQKSGNIIAKRDVAVFFRKNGVDTPVDHTLVSTISGTTITFTRAILTSEADYVVASYPYALSGDKTTFTCVVKSFDKSGGESDSEVENTIGGCSYKKKLPPSLVEISLTAIKKDVSLSQACNGEIVTATINGRTVKTTTSANNRVPRVIVIRGDDPVNTSISLIAVARNVDGVSADHSGGAEDSWEEEVTFKTNKDDYFELEVQ